MRLFAYFQESLVSQRVAERSALMDDIVNGLSYPQKSIPARHFYDHRGSELFERITQLPEYYPTRTETALLKQHGSDIARFTGHGCSIIEFGSGSSVKTPILLNAVHASAYVPIDISAEFLTISAQRLALAHPHVAVFPIAGDFSKLVTLPDVARPLTGFFPGSTLGNFYPAAAVNLLRSFRATLGDDAWLVIGLDTRKSQAILEAAYNDPDGVTAAFNLNVLRRINRELDGSIDEEKFEHRAIWNSLKGRVEMHLVALYDMEFGVAGQQYNMTRGETIHTENSYKYTLDEARMLARSAGWEPMANWGDADNLFALHLWRAADMDGEP
jgi:L-histidine Nalpha-methyltransferase